MCRIHKDAVFQKIPVKVRDQRADVSGKASCPTSVVSQGYYGVSDNVLGDGIQKHFSKTCSQKVRFLLTFSWHTLGGKNSCEWSSIVKIDRCKPY
jgi:hypothetical protein